MRKHNKENQNYITWDEFAFSSNGFNSERKARRNWKKLVREQKRNNRKLAKQ